MTSSHSRVTQRTIAEIAGVSQSTVSLVLNGKADGARRIPAATRDRVLEVIRETTYIANPVARSLAGLTNDLIGVFTYEPAFPNRTSDFYTPLLTGIESAAEKAGADLLVFTSTPVIDGRRRIFHESNRLRLADGCILLGREMDADELEGLLETGYPFVAVGRRDAAAGRVPYVGVDYAAATRDLAQRALANGHERIGVLRLPLDAESSRDRRSGLHDGLDGRGQLAEVEIVPGLTVVEAWQTIRAQQPTVVFVEDPVDAQTLFEHLLSEGVSVPEDISIVVLGEHSRPRDRAVDFTRLSAPRIQLGARAVEVLVAQLLEGSDGSAASAAREPVHELLPCTIVPGATLGAPSG